MGTSPQQHKSLSLGDSTPQGSISTTLCRWDGELQSFATKKLKPFYPFSSRTNKRHSVSIRRAGTRAQLCHRSCVLQTSSFVSLGLLPSSHSAGLVHV